MEVDLTWRLVKKKGEEIKFTRAEYNLLTYFLKNPDRALWRSRYPELRPGPIRGLSAAEPAPFQTGPLLTYGHPDGHSEPSLYGRTSHHPRNRRDDNGDASVWITASF